MTAKTIAALTTALDHFLRLAWGEFVFNYQPSFNRSSVTY
ncbi:hypothetical protein [Sporisorium scitamineum]|uniref:Uncharacterized protein n=1 Tax=Sporisorium scitamineum TaxID=49012 RepID=A0A0F7S6G7_9BASI|nr:hypothetical protein [Sporisorium scitamineum]